MRLVLLIAALLLMMTALTSPLWDRRASAPPPSQTRRLQRTLVSGRIKGDFPDRPWNGTLMTFGNEKVALNADGTFRFSVFPGVHILTVCCSDRFQQIYREIEVEDRELYFELEATPLRKVTGQLVTPKGKALRYAVNVSAWLVGTNSVAKTVVASDGSFAFHLSEGSWKLSVDNPNLTYRLGSISFDGMAVRDETIVIADVRGPSLPLQITLK